MSLLAHLNLVGDTLSDTVGASIRCAVKEDLDPDAEKELRFCLPTLTDVQVVDCVDYSERKDAAKILWHVFQKAQEGKDRGIFIKFSQYAEVAQYVEQMYNYKFPQTFFTKISSNFFLRLMETNVCGQIKRGYHFRRQNTVRFDEFNSEYTMLVFNKNVFFIPANLWNRVIHIGYKDAIFGEECSEVRLFTKVKKTIFKMLFRVDSPILLQAEVVLDKLVAKQKIKEGKPFCAIRGDQFVNLNLPTYNIVGRTNNSMRDYRMYRKIVAKGHIKAKKKSNVKEFTIIYLDFFDEHESNEVILEPNATTEMIGRSITMLIIPQNCQVRMKHRIVSRGW